MKIEFRKKGQHNILSVIGDISYTNVATLKEAANNLLEESDIQSFVIDLSQLNYSDSSGIGVFLNISKQCKTKNIKFALLGVTAKVKDIFTVSSLDQMFDFLEESELD